MTVHEYLQKKNYNYQVKRRPKGMEAIMNCPFHEDRDKKFGISLDDGAFLCMAQNKCGVQGSWYDFQKLLGDVPIPLSNQVKTFRQVKTNWIRPQVKKARTKDNILAYFKEQGINSATVSKFKIGETSDGTAIMYPYFKDGVLVGVKYRNIKDKKMWSEKDQEPVLFNRDNITGDELIITEGEKDCMTLGQLGMQSVSIPNGVNDGRWIDNEWDWLDKFKKIYLVMDNDRAGREAAQKLSMRLGNWRCYNVILPEKDPNNYLKKYGDKAGDIINYFNAADTFNPKNLINIADITDAVIEIFNSPEKLHGIQTPFPGLNNLIRGWRAEELTVWSGQNSAGKSTILNQVIIDLVERGEKNCIASMEMPLYRLGRWLVLQMSRGENPTDYDIKRRLDKLGEGLWAVTNTYNIEIDILLDVFTFAVRRYDVKHIFVDSLMKIRMPFADELKAQKQVVTKLVDFAKEYKCHVHLVAHPRKGARDNIELWKVDVSGTADITNLAHNVITLVRVPEVKKEKDKKKGLPVYDAVLSVKKNREWGDEGYIKLLFDRDSKLFEELF
jgi:twinkle protein